MCVTEKTRHYINSNWRANGHHSDENKGYIDMYKFVSFFNGCDIKIHYTMFNSKESYCIVIYSDGTIENVLTREKNKPLFKHYTF